MPHWVLYVAQLLVVAVIASTTGVVVPLVNVSLQTPPRWDVAPRVIAYPEALKTLNLPEDLYVGDAIALEDGGMLLACTAWSPYSLTGNNVLLRFAADDTLQWHWSSGLMGNNTELNDPVHLGGERFAVQFSEITEKREINEEILIIESGKIVHHVMLGYRESRPSLSHHLYPAPDGFYLHVAQTGIYEDMSVMNSITFYDRDGQQRYTKTFDDGVSFSTLVAVEDGLLAVGTHEETKSLWKKGICARLDGEGNELWITQTSREFPGLSFTAAAALDDGGYLLMGGISGEETTYAYGLDDSGTLLFSHPILPDSNDLGYNSIYSFVHLGDNLAMLQSTYVDPVRAQITILNQASDPISIYTLATDFEGERASINFAFFTFLIAQNDELYFARKTYINPQTPYILRPLTSSQHWHPLTN